jgi:AraC-like DNA-binding protein
MNAETATARMPVTLKTLPPGGYGQPDLVRVDFNQAPALPAPADATPVPTTSRHQKVVESLAASPRFREYQQAFRDATGLPLTLRPVGGWQLSHQGDPRQNAFCGLMSQANRSCSACLQMQQRVCDGANEKSCTLKCTFGFYETSVAVRIGHETIAHLQTGQVLFKAPTPEQTQRAVKQLEAWGLHLDAAEVKRIYQATKVIRQNEYQARVRLLEFFADQLAALANQIVVQQEHAEPEQITRARRFIEANYQEEMDLSTVARSAGMSRFYFCKTFKKVTGVNYTKYVTRVRVEKAKHLLLNRNFRISEIAYEVGFQSLAHFNRAFRSIACETPSEFRSHLSSN